MFLTERPARKAHREAAGEVFGVIENSLRQHDAKETQMIPPSHKATDEDAASAGPVEATPISAPVLLSMTYPTDMATT